MNRLQTLETDEPFFVTLNPTLEPRAETIHNEFKYTHPYFDQAALASQKEYGPCRAAAGPGSAEVTSVTASMKTPCNRAWRLQNSWVASDALGASRPKMAGSPC